ncbi:MAG: NADH-quinone oxidoreductase subunit NuoE [Bradymonadaceae bacterium]
MLSDAEREEIEHELETVPTKRAACIGALKAVQRQRGWVSDEALEEIGEFLDMSVDQLDSVATFFNLIYRQPVGDHVILVCDSISCFLCGYEQLRDALCEELEIGGFGETTDDGRFTLLPMCCLGDCDKAPVMMVGEDTHDEVDPDEVGVILEEYD